MPPPRQKVSDVARSYAKSCSTHGLSRHGKCGARPWRNRKTETVSAPPKPGPGRDRTHQANCFSSRHHFKIPRWHNAACFLIYFLAVTQANAHCLSSILLRHFSNSRNTHRSQYTPTAQSSPARPQLQVIHNQARLLCSVHIKPRLRPPQFSIPILRPRAASRSTYASYIPVLLLNRCTETLATTRIALNDFAAVVIRPPVRRPQINVLRPCTCSCAKLHPNKSPRVGSIATIGHQQPRPR